MVGMMINNPRSEEYDKMVELSLNVLILHIHEYVKKGDFSIRPNRLLTQEEFNLYKKYFKGVIL